MMAASHHHLANLDAIFDEIDVEETMSRDVGDECWAVDVQILITALVFCSFESEINKDMKLPSPTLSRVDHSKFSPLHFIECLKKFCAF
jgi:hypothetical protein